MNPAHARVAAVALLLAAAGCDVKTSDADLRGAFIDPPAANEKLHARAGLLEGKTSACWVDPRSPAEYAKGHIAGAISVPLTDIQETAHARLAGHNVFIVYGDGFQDPMAKAAAKRLIEVGYKKKEVFILEGGTRAWQKEGYALVTGSLPEGGDPKPVEKPAATGGFEVPEKGVK